ncbi:MAG: TatD family hydrolase [Candidatus Atabeyarchaeum deiterrae]
MLIDVHCHIDDKSFDNDREEVLGRASNVVVLNAGVDPSSNRKTLEITDKYRNVKACLGLHPEFIANFSEYVIGKEITWISSQAKRIVAISEIGLDYYWVKDEEQREKQRILFRRMLALADDLGLPVIVHSRDAPKDTLSILREFPRLKVVLHGFSEPDNMGYFVSVAPNICRNKMKQRQVAVLPMEVLLTETDSPLLGIDPKERNEPRNVLQVVKKISELRDMSAEAAIAAISRNAKNLFPSWWDYNDDPR